MCGLSIQSLRKVAIVARMHTRPPTGILARHANCTACMQVPVLQEVNGNKEGNRRERLPLCPALRLSDSGMSQGLLSRFQVHHHFPHPLKRKPNPTHLQQSNCPLQTLLGKVLLQGGRLHSQTLLQATVLQVSNSVRRKQAQPLLRVAAMQRTMKKSQASQAQQ